MVTKRDKICGASFFIIGFIALAAGFVIFAILPQIIRKRVEHEVTLKEGSFSERTWQDPPYNISIQFWIFNVTNADQILTGATPVLVQKGPYGFREKQRKERLRFLENDTVAYVNYKEYFWDRAMSCSKCSEDDIFTVPNIPYLTALKLIRDRVPGFPLFLMKVLLATIGEKPFISSKKARELLFDGYKDPILDLINVFKKGSVPDKMGLFYGKNSTNDGLYVIRTGADDAASVGRVVAWENRTDLYRTGWWRPAFPDANMINGTDGTVYHPFISRKDILPIFIRDVCRSLYLTYESDVQVQGIAAYRFVVPPEVFSANVTANHGFCWPSRELFYSESIQRRDSGGWCLPSGMLDVSKCQNGAPIVITSPQFASCPDEVKASVEGLYPESEEFLTFLDIEPVTGAVLAGSRRIQLNAAMYSEMISPGLFKKMKSVIVPVVWINESVRIDANTRDYIYNQVVTNIRTAYIVDYATIGLGSTLLFIFLVFIIFRLVEKRRGRKDDDSSILTEPSLPSEA